MNSRGFVTSYKLLILTIFYKLQTSLRRLKYSNPCPLLLNQLKVVSYPSVTYGDDDEDDDDEEGDEDDEPYYVVDSSTLYSLLLPSNLNYKGVVYL